MASYDDSGWGYWHRKSIVGSNLCLLKAVGAVGWQPTGFGDKVLASKEQCWVQLVPT